MIQHLFSDMDGTILDKDGYVAPSTIEALAEVELPLTLVSARSPIEMDEAIHALNLTAEQVGFNGGIIYRGTGASREILYERPLEFDTAKQLITILRNHFPELSLSFYDRQHWYTDKRDAGIDLEQRITRVAPTFINFATYLAQEKGPIFKLMLIIFNEDEMAQIQHFIHSLNLPLISVLRSGREYLEITHADATKAYGIDYIQSIEHLTAAQCAGLGDGHNDIPMFQRVGHRIVMANAKDEIKTYADFVTKANDQGGIAHALRQYILPRKS